MGLAVSTSLLHASHQCPPYFDVVFLQKIHVAKMLIGPFLMDSSFMVMLKKFVERLKNGPLTPCLQVRPDGRLPILYLQQC